MQPNRSVTPPKGGAAPRRGAAIRILVIDDEPDVCDYLVMLLEKEGYAVDAESDPVAGLERFHAGDYHLVILDIMMPGMDGTAVLEQIRRGDREVAVIVFTGYPSVETAVESLRHQAQDYLKKPLRVDALKAAVRRVLTDRGLIVDSEAALHAAIGKKIRGMRTSRSLTLKQVAGRTGLSVSLISQIERAESSASLSSLYKIAAAFGVPLTELLDGH